MLDLVMAGGMECLRDGPPEARWAGAYELLPLLEQDASNSDAAASQPAVARLDLRWPPPPPSSV